MAISIKLSLDKTAIEAETLNGHPISLSRNPVEAYNTLLRLLRVQSEPKVVKPPIGVTPHLILAEWERVGPTGAGKVHKGTKPARVVNQTTFDSKGNIVKHNKSLDFI